MLRCSCMYACAPRHAGESYHILASPCMQPCFYKQRAKSIATVVEAVSMRFSLSHIFYALISNGRIVFWSRSAENNLPPSSWRRQTTRSIRRSPRSHSRSSIACLWLLQANANEICFMSLVTLYCSKMMLNLGGN